MRLNVLKYDMNILSINMLFILFLKVLIFIRYFYHFLKFWYLISFFY